jgi:hypothetical protein
VVRHGGFGFIPAGASIIFQWNGCSHWPQVMTQSKI